MPLSKANLTLTELKLANFACIMTHFTLYHLRRFDVVKFHEVSENCTVCLT